MQTSTSRVMVFPVKVFTLDPRLGDTMGVPLGGFPGLEGNGTIMVHGWGHFLATAWPKPCSSASSLGKSCAFSLAMPKSPANH